MIQTSEASVGGGFLGMSYEKEMDGWMDGTEHISLLSPLPISVVHLPTLSHDVTIGNNLVPSCYASSTFGPGFPRPRVSLWIIFSVFS